MTVTVPTLPALSAGNRSGARRAQRRFAGAADVQIRELDSGLVEFSGYAAVFNERSVGLPWVEVIKPGAFRASLAGGPEVVLVLNHNPDTVIARTSNQTLTLAEDARGLAVTATLDPTDPDAARAIAKLRARNWDSMSFMFWDLTPAEERHHQAADGVDEVWVTRADIDGGDTSIVTWPAYAGTLAEVRTAIGASPEPADARHAFRRFVETLGVHETMLRAELDRRAAHTRAAGLTIDDLWLRVDRALSELLPAWSWSFDWWLQDLADDWAVVRVWGDHPDAPISDGWWQYPYTIDDAGTVTFDAPAEVLPRTVYEPAPPAAADQTVDSPPAAPRASETGPGDTPETMSIDAARRAAAPATTGSLTRCRTCCSSGPAASGKPSRSTSTR